MKELVVIVFVIGSGYLTKSCCEPFLVKACSVFESQGADDVTVHRWIGQVERGISNRGSKTFGHASLDNSFNAADQLNRLPGEQAVPQRIVVSVGRDRVPSKQFESF